MAHSAELSQSVGVQIVSETNLANMLDSQHNLQRSINKGETILKEETCCFGGWLVDVVDPKSYTVAFSLIGKLLHSNQTTFILQPLYSYTNISMGSI